MSTGGWRSLSESARGCRIGLEEDSSRLHRSGERGEERKSKRRVLWVFIISPSRLDSVKLWNNPLMSPPCRVDRMPTKLSDFSLICSLALLLYVSRFLVALVASFHFPIAFLRLLLSFWYEPSRAQVSSSSPLSSSSSFHQKAWPMLRSWLLQNWYRSLWLCFKRVAWLIPPRYKN